jgi:Family of unknown function (DUF6084)
MTDLRFTILGAEPKQHAAMPTIVFRLQIRTSERIEAIVLRTQIRIEPQWRTYGVTEQQLLVDLFGTPDRWNKTLHALAWADVPVMIPAFQGETEVDVNVPCTYDFDVSASRFFSALDGGEIPLRFLFSGSIFRHGENAFSVDLISWSSECAYRMPVQVWRGAMQACYGDSIVVRVDRETYEELLRRRTAIGERA